MKEDCIHSRQAKRRYKKIASSVADVRRSTVLVFRHLDHGDFKNHHDLGSQTKT